MKPFKPISEPMKVEFFSIFTDENGNRFIHLHGYTYDSDGNPDFESEDNPDGEYWANMEASGIVVPLEEFIREYEKDEEGEYTDGLYCEASQYQGDFDDAGIVEIINHYYRDVVFSIPRTPGEGNPDAWLSYGEVTMDTKDGQYITEN